MTYDRDRRPRPRRPDDRRPSPGGYRPNDRPRPPQGGRPPYQNRPPRPSFAGAPDEGAMSIRLDPRHLGTLRTLASEAGVRPGELVTLWVTERLDAERRGAPSPGDISAVLESLNGRIEALSRRVDALAAGGGKARAEAAAPDAAKAEAAPAAESAPTTADAPKRRGRPPKTTAATNGVKRRPTTRKSPRGKGKNPAVPLHDEIAAVLAERGPMSAADLASTITERAIYAPPRSGKPLDATAVSVRVSNPRYRSRFTRSGGMIGLAN